MRDDYTLETHPVYQVMKQVEAIRSGSVQVDGRPVKLCHENAPAFGFVLCDVTPSFKSGAERLQMIKTHGEEGYILFDRGLNLHIEVISYDRMLDDAEKRNHILFRKLGIEP
jgi:hypothetical protein